MIEKYDLKEMLREIAEEADGQQQHQPSKRMSQEEIKELLRLKTARPQTAEGKNEKQS